MIGNFVKKCTEGAISHRVDAVGEDITEKKNTSKKRLHDIREGSRIKKKIEPEKKRNQKDLDEYLQQGSAQSPVFPVPSQSNAATDSVLRAIFCPNDTNNNTPKTTPNSTKKDNSNNAADGPNCRCQPGRERCLR